MIDAFPRPKRLWVVAGFWGQGRDNLAHQKKAVMQVDWVEVY
jgi:hypothetical protein